MTSNGKQRILVAPLDWGMGHATRCAPLIDGWLAEGHEVILASNGRSACWLKQRYPQIEVLTDIPDYAVTYPADGNMTFHFAKHLLRLLRVVHEEHDWLRRIVNTRSITCIYSDNRYGLHHKDVPSALITHQLYVRVPWWARFPINRMMHSYFNRFHAIWVPDNREAPLLSGVLSHGGRWDKKARYIGPLSRFSQFSEKVSESQFEIVALISGPEPTRTSFEQQLRQIILATNLKSLIVQGRPEETYHESEGNLSVVNHLPDSVLAAALRGASLIICRSGYSTLMDLAALGVRALLVPTPGQTEQEYLANYHTEQGTHDAVAQSHLKQEVLLSALRRNQP